MSEPFLGEVRTFGFDYAPRGWAFCQGQTLTISQHQPLFSLLGISFGGDGNTTFLLPNFAGRAGLNMGRSLYFGTNYRLGSVGGHESVRLTNETIPNHNHNLTAAGSNGKTESPSNALVAKGVKSSGKETTPWPSYAEADDEHMVDMNAQAIEPAGRGYPHENRQPFLVLNFCIAMEGLYPQRS